MKILFLFIGLNLPIVSTLAQGAVHFGNSSATPISIRLLDGTERPASAHDGLIIGAFYGPALGMADTLAVVANIGSQAGVMVNAPDIFRIPGADPGQTVSIQIRAWDAALGSDGWREASQDCVGGFYGETRISQITLGPTDGPPAVIWQGWGDLNPNRFYPMLVYQCPEPSIFTLGALGGLGWLIFLRRRK